MRTLHDYHHFFIDKSIGIPGSIKLTCLYFFVALISPFCKKPFVPKIDPVHTNFLVVDGFINAQGSSDISLTRSAQLSDTSQIQPEPGASVSIMGEDNSTYQLPETTNGHYISGPLNLNKNQKYRLLIKTTVGKDYLSDYVQVKQTPEIDSITWKKVNNEVQISVNTHDPQNNTRYYQWQYEETWEYHAFEPSQLVYVGGTFYRRNKSDQVEKCWHMLNSTNVLVGTSNNLGEDIISQYLLTRLENGSEKTTVRYSILVKQYARTKEAFEFWTQLKKNTEQIGGLFGSQPSELTGNIHCTTNSKEVVIGFVSACTSIQKRIFISYEDIAYLGFGPPWPRFPNPQDCVEQLVHPNQKDFDYYFDKYSVLWVPVDSAFDFYGNYVGITRGETRCSDCTEQRGTNIKPDYWP